MGNLYFIKATYPQKNSNGGENSSLTIVEINQFRDRAYGTADRNLDWNALFPLWHFTLL